MRLGAGTLGMIMETSWLRGPTTITTKETGCGSFGMKMAFPIHRSIILTASPREAVSGITTTEEKKCRENWMGEKKPGNGKNGMKTEKRNLKGFTKKENYTAHSKVIMKPVN